MLTFIAAVMFIPFGLLADHFSFIRGLPPLEQELTKASHGVFMIIAAGWLAHLHLEGWEYGVPDDYQGYILPALALLAVWGIWWIVIGAARSRHYQDYHLLGRAVGKVALGIGLGVLLLRWNTHYVWQEWVWNAGMVAVAFCLVTGVTKVVLCLRPLPRVDLPDPPMSHGNADFVQGNGLQ